MIKNFVLGDTGGHGNALLNSLVKIGLDVESFVLPEDVRIIHIGDLIHKGPDSNMIVPLVNHIMKINPGQWIQLLGNHEFQHIKGAPAFWRCDCNALTQSIIHDWWESNQSVAFSIPSFHELKVEVSDKPKIVIPDHGLLFTHSGITRPFWKEMGSLTDITELADAINLAPIKVASRPGIMLENPFAKNKNPGPAWALSTEEVFRSWLDTDMPFIQFHGHTAPYTWMRKNWFPGTPKIYKQATRLNVEDRASITAVANSVMIGVDPSFEMNVDLLVQPSLSFTSSV